jgi:putative phosphonate metabolism protein
LPEARPDSLRIAAYYAPAADDLLHIAGSSWLGRDARADAAVPQPETPGMAEATAEPRRYGFHATLKAPMRLRAGTTIEQVAEAARAIASRLPPFALPPLVIAQPHGFLALREASPCPQLQALADACIAGLDAFRAPLSSAELSRRQAARLSATEEQMLHLWGYPYAFKSWFFHMTLTRRLTEDEAALFRPAAEAHFAPALTSGRRVEEICLFVQQSAGGDFALAGRAPLQGQ